MMPMGVMNELDEEFAGPDAGGSRLPQANFPLPMERNDGGYGMPMPDFPFGQGRQNGGMPDRDGRGMPIPPPPYDGGMGGGNGGYDGQRRQAPLSLDQLTGSRQAQGGGGGKGKGKGRGKRGDQQDPMQLMAEMPGMAMAPAGMPMLPERQLPPPAWANVTTVMMRNLPNKYTQRMLLTEVNQVGFLGTFDFLYLPIDPETNANRGYAFLNFIDPSFAWMFKMSYENRKMNRFNSSKVVSVMPATLQGFDANYTHYSTARVNRGDPAARPLFLREPAQPLINKASGRDGFNKRNNRRKGGGNGGSPGGPPMTGGGPDMPIPYPKDGNFPGGDLSTMLSANPMPGGDAGDGDRPSVPKFCPHCGGPIQAHFQFCPHCGANVDFSGMSGGKQY